MKGKRRKSWPLALFLLGIAVGLGIGSYFGTRHVAPPRVFESPQPHGPSEAAPPLRPAKKNPPTPSAKRPAPHSRVAFIIDDMGYNLQIALPFLRSPFPLAVSILPDLPYSKSVCQAAQKAGKIFLLHLPMEAEANNRFLGPGAIFTSMSDADLKRVIEHDLQTVPGVEGLNNHMGSKATADPRVAGVVASEAKEHHLFVIDSLTSPDSVLYQEAVTLHVPAARREIFLDDEVTVPYIRGQMEALIKVAVARGEAIAIGHPHPQTLQVLVEMIPKMEEEGIEVVPVTQLL